MRPALTLLISGQGREESLGIYFVTRLTSLHFTEWNISVEKKFHDFYSSVIFRLLKESQQLEENKELLNQKTKETEDIINNLDMVRASLERDVRVKKISLNIDKNKCLPLRAIFKFDISAKINKK